MRRASLALSVFVLTATACGVFGTDDEPSSSSGGGSSSGGKPPEETSKPPGVDGKPLEGIFVSQTKGNDATGDGSMAKPLATLAAGLAKGQKDRQRVLVCAETYTEQVTWLDGVSAYGYFDCQGPEWKLDETRRAKVQSPKSPALKAEGINQPTRIEGFEIVAPDFGEGSPDEREPMQNSSIAAFVKGSSALTIGKSTLKGGKGRDGVDGTEPAGLQRVIVRNAGVGRGEAGDCDGLLPGQCHGIASYAVLSGGVGAITQCDGAPGFTPGPGGDGGSGGHWDGSFAEDLSTSGERAAATRGLPAVATPETAAGGAVQPAMVGGYYVTERTRGSDGGDGARGTDGANGVLAIRIDGVAPGDGARGTDGAVGQGGGGGSGLPFRSAKTLHNLGPSGGGGGGGGCPGLAGSPGLGGGASVAILVVQSTLSIERATLASSKGGRAGRGTLGSLESAGTPGSPSNPLVDTRALCIDGGLNAAQCRGAFGGDGGSGGRAGVSGHGAAGVSAGIVHIGEAPRVDGETVIAPGPGGDGQAPLGRNGATIPEAPVGASEKVIKGGP